MLNNGRRPRLVGLAASVLSLGLIASACGGGAGDSGGGGGGGAQKEPINIGYITWDEDVAATELWEHILEKRGYKVQTTQLEVAGLFSGMAEGDIDLFLDTWLPVTHKQYWNRFGDDLTKLGTWYNNASLEISVPKYAPIDSLSELGQYAKRYNGEIIGIEAGAGLTDITKKKVIPQYNLSDKFQLRTGSTPTMLAALEKATNNKDPIVVTLWHPHWAYAAYPIKDLKDPKNALGGAEKIVTTARTDFAQDYPKVAKWMGNFKMNDEQLSTLENLVIQKYSDNPQKGVQQWISDNQDLVNQWTGGSSG